MLYEGVSNSEIQQELGRLTSHRELISSPRLSRLLRFLVDETLIGRGEQLNEYEIAEKVFERSGRFDPLNDSIVRVQVAKLRTKLRAIYLEGGHPLQIELPARSYLPHFERVPATAPASGMHVAGRQWMRPAWWIAGALAAGLGCWTLYRATRPTPVRPTSVAVLPFLNLTGDPSKEYLTDGLSEEIIDALAKVRGLRISARTSSFQFKGAKIDLREVGRRLGVQAVLEGSVRQSGDLLKITAQLNSAVDGLHLWSETYASPAGDTFATQERIARAVVQRMGGRAEDQPLANRYAKSPTAYQSWLRGRYLYERTAGAGTDGTAIRKHYEEAIAADPGFAPAYAGLADCYWLLGNESRLDAKTAYRLSKGAAEKALALDNRLADAYFMLARWRRDYEFDWSGAEAGFRKAIELSPGTSRFHSVLGAYLSTVGRGSEGIAEMEAAMATDPLRFQNKSTLSRALYFDRQYDRAIAVSREIQAVEPASEMGYVLMGLSLLQQSHVPEALAILERGRAISRTSMANWLGLMGHAYAVAGRKGEARAMLRQIDELARKQYIQPTIPARVLLGLGEYDRMFDLLERALEEHDLRLLETIQDPRFDVVRSHPRFQALLERIGLPAVRSR
jgi:TolB-like protein/Flp pilus assembly protein TadD